MNGNGVRVHIIFDVPKAKNTAEAMKRLGLTESSQYTPPDGTVIVSYAGIPYNVVGGTTAIGQLEDNRVTVTREEI